MSASVRERVFDFSNPALYNPSFIPLLNNKSEFLHLWGSAGSGKSHFEAQREVIKSFNSVRKNRRTIVARKVFATLRESCYAQLKRIIFEWDLNEIFHCTTSPLMIVNKVTGVEFSFRGFDDPEKIKSIVGADRAWYEETTDATNMKEILQLRNRLRGFSEVQVTCTYNPVDEHHWINEQIHETGLAGHDLHHSTYHDNVRMLEVDHNYEPWIEGTRLSDPNYYRVYGLGLWGRVSAGLMYPDAKIIHEWPVDGNGEFAAQWYGLDFGYTNPTALIAQRIIDAPDKPRILNHEVLYERNLDGPALLRRFKELKVRKDLLIIADSAQPGLIKTLRDADYNVRPCVKFAGSVLVGINDLRKFQIEITAGSKETIKEVRNYQKQELPGERWTEEPAKGQQDHGMDAIRYGVQRAILPARKRKRMVSSSTSMFGG